MIVIQFIVFSRKLSPYPRYARWFNLLTGAIPCVIAAALLGPDTAAGGALGTMALIAGNALTFGGLLLALP